MAPEGEDDKSGPLATPSWPDDAPGWVGAQLSGLQAAGYPSSTTLTSLSRGVMALPKGWGCLCCLGFTLDFLGSYPCSWPERQSNLNFVIESDLRFFYRTSGRGEGKDLRFAMTFFRILHSSKAEISASCRSKRQRQVQGDWLALTLLLSILSPLILEH